MNVLLEKAIMDSLAELYPKASIDFWEDFANTPTNELHDFHYTLGEYVRNEMLKSGSALEKLFLSKGISDLEDMSRVVLKLWHEKLNLNRPH